MALYNNFASQTFTLANSVGGIFGIINDVLANKITVDTANYAVYFDANSLYGFKIYKTASHYYLYLICNGSTSTVVDLATPENVTFTYYVKDNGEMLFDINGVIFAFAKYTVDGVEKWGAISLYNAALKVCCEMQTTISSMTASVIAASTYIQLREIVIKDLPIIFDRAYINVYGTATPLTIGTIDNTRFATSAAANGISLYLAL